MVLMLSFTAACSWQAGVLSSIQTAGTGHELPFDTGSEKGGLSPTQAFASTPVPVGTAIVICLQASLSSANARAGDGFDAVLDQPVIVNGQTLMPQGTMVKGTVMAVARASGRSQDAGYLRLTLSSIVINGRILAAHTSSVFAKGEWPDRDRAATRAKFSEANQNRLVRTDPISKLPGEPGSGGQREAKFSTGRRLTFRLVQALPLIGQEVSRIGTQPLKIQ